MPFKKLIEPLKDVLLDKGYESPLPFQKLSLSKIKGGANVFGIAPKESGKTTALIISVLQKLKGKAFEDAPRALIFVKDKQAALDLEAAFKSYTRRIMDLRICCVYDQRDIDAQRDELYEGSDIVIATPRRLNKVFYMNGIDLNKLQLFIVEDAEFLLRNSSFGEVSRITESLNRCQYLVFTTEYDPRFERWKESFMYNAQTLKLK